LGYQLFANPPEGSAYLRRTASVAKAQGNEATRLDIELVKGVVVTGRVTDKQTGKGVSAGVRFAPLPGNEFFPKPGYDGYKSDRTMNATDRDGRFSFATIPGKSLLMVQAHGGEKVNGVELCPYLSAEPDPACQELFKYEKDDDIWLFTSAGGLELLKIENAVKLVDLKEGAGEVKVEVSLDRGKTAPIAVQDAEGKPLAGVVASGVTAHWPITYKLAEATATVFALNPEKPRRLVFLHPEKKLGGSAVVRGDEKEPVVVKLSPLGSATGQYVEIDGGPLDGATITLQSRDPIAAELYRYLARTAPPVKADKEGRFTVTGIVPNVKFYLQANVGQTYFSPQPSIGEKEVEADKTLDFGERKLKPAR
jgi:hypothetical protein